MSVLSTKDRGRVLTASTGDCVAFFVRGARVSYVRPPICVGSLYNDFQVLVVSRRRVHSPTGGLSNVDFEVQKVGTSFRSNNNLSTKDGFRYVPATKTSGQAAFYRTMDGNMKRACLFRGDFCFNVREDTTSGSFIRVASGSFRDYLTNRQFSFIVSSECFRRWLSSFTVRFERSVFLSGLFCGRECTESGSKLGLQREL